MRLTNFFTAIARRLNPVANLVGTASVVLFISSFFDLFPGAGKPVEFILMIIAFWGWGGWYIWFFYFPRRNELIDGKFKKVSNAENCHPTMVKIYNGWFVFWFIFMIYFTVVTF